MVRDITRFYPVHHRLARDGVGRRRGCAWDGARRSCAPDVHRVPFAPPRPLPARVPPTQVEKKAKEFTWAEIKEHNLHNDCWVVIHGKGELSGRPCFARAAPSRRPAPESEPC